MIIWNKQLFLWTLQNITINTNPFIKHIGLHTSGQDIDPFLLFQNISLHTSGQDIYPFYFSKYRPQTYGQDITYSSEAHDKGDPFGKLLE